MNKFQTSNEGKAADGNSVHYLISVGCLLCVFDCSLMCVVVIVVVIIVIIVVIVVVIAVIVDFFLLMAHYGGMSYGVRSEYCYSEASPIPTPFLSGVEEEANGGAVGAQDMPDTRIWCARPGCRNQPRCALCQLWHERHDGQVQ